MKKENVFLDLSKLNRTHKEYIYDLATYKYCDKEYFDDGFLFLNNEGNFDIIRLRNAPYLYNKTEVTYEQFISLFKTYPREMEVSDIEDFKNCIKCKVEFEYDDLFWVRSSRGVLEGWKYAREIEEPKKLELTFDEAVKIIAEAKGEKIENILIKK